MKQNQVCYYIEDSQFGMHVSYGIYEYKTMCTHKVSRLKAPEISSLPFTVIAFRDQYSLQR